VAQEDLANLVKEKRQPRKTIGQEGSRRQTLLLFLILLIIGLLLYLPQEFKNLPKNQSVITIESKQPRRKNIIEIVKPKPSKPPRAEIEAKIQQLIAGKPGQYGVWAGATDENESIAINADKIYTAASVIKLPALTVYYQAVDSGKIDPEEIYVLAERDRWEYGTGSMQNQPAGKEYTYRQVAQLVANQSDNMGAEVLIKKLGGYAAAQKEIDKLNLGQTNLKENETSPENIGQLLVQLSQREILSSTSRDELFTNLTKTINEDRIPAGVPEGVRVVHKFGSEDGVVNDCGIVEADNPYVICVLTTEINSGEAETLLPQISEVIWSWLGD
jgi:beta-lactamase class A